jgi:Cu(I)/Ag(I) efflux system membrane fusion protein
MLKKNQAIYKLYSEDIAIAKQDYFLAYNNWYAWRFWQNAKSMLKPPKQKLLFYGLSNAQIESIKGKKQISPYLLL